MSSCLLLLTRAVNIPGVCGRASGLQMTKVCPDGNLTLQTILAGWQLKTPQTWLNTIWDIPFKTIWAMFNDSWLVHLATTGDSTLGQESQAASLRVNERSRNISFPDVCLFVSVCFVYLLV